MSVLIKGMDELPEDGQMLVVKHVDGKAYIKRDDVMGFSMELVQLPDNHGRLVDADALEKEGWSLHRDIQVDKNTREYQTKPLRQVPTIEPERKKGKWLPDNNSVYEMRFVCSECKESQVVPTIGFTKYKPIWDFCPNCGADMREPEDIPMEYFESGGR